MAVIDTRAEARTRAATTAAPAGRVASIDLVRGLVMIVMALDHVRELVHRGAMTGAQPTDLQSTTELLFATRWITHFCAPTFALTAGLGAWLWLSRGRSRARLAGFLVSRGLWLVLLELVVVRFSMYFSWSLDYPIILTVLWSLGLSMVALAALIWLPRWLIALLAVATILLHPLLDGITADQFGAFAGLWNVIHQLGAFHLGEAVVVTPYTIIPWVGVVALGYALGPLFAAEPRRRRLWLVVLGVAAIVGFVVMRTINVYGDPAPWGPQESPLFTLVSFLNATKYPASPAFLLMTLGPIFLLLAWLDRPPRAGGWLSAAAGVFGRAPLFYFILHLYVAHLIASAMTLLAYGWPALDFAVLAFPSSGAGTADRFPDGFGYDLWVVYVVWLAVLAVCYPLCRWYAGVKARRRDWWLGYL